MSPEEYLHERLDGQINWYSGKSRWNQQCFKRLRAIEILFAVAIPFLVSQISAASELLKLATGAMGIAVALIAGLVTLYRFQENWIEYRTTAETLKHEKYLYLTHSAPYHGDDAFHVLVARVESSISRENSGWAQATRSPATVNGAA